MSAAASLSILAWAFVPNLVTGWAQSIYYGITIRAGDPKPQPGSQRYVQHYRRIKIIIIIFYLLYTIYEADWDIRRAGDYYQDLSVPHDVEDRALKSRFRRLAALHHPDKVSASNPSSEGHFVHLKLAQDTLLDPVKRFAYDRFGPGITEWRNCASIRDYIMHGLPTTLVYYVFSAIVMYVLGKMGYMEWGAYWRWFTTISLCVFEVHALSRPYFPTIAAKFINPVISTFASHPPYLPFQLITLFRKMALTLFIAFSQIGPLLEPPEVQKMRANPEAALKQSLERLDHAAKATDVDATRLFELEMAPYKGDPQALSDVKSKAKGWLIQNVITSDPEVRDACGKLMKRRRLDAPVGARGNR